MISLKLFLIWIAAISLLAVVITASDKSRAKKREWRVPEWILFFTSFLGGSVAMYLTMHIIRHKTQHASFMVGIPFIIVFQMIALSAALHYGLLVV